VEALCLLKTLKLVHAYLTCVECFESRLTTFRQRSDNVLTTKPQARSLYSCTKSMSLFGDSCPLRNF
jgi:hypothetical protein